MKQKTIQWIQEQKLIAIVRGIDKKDILPTANALYEGGIRLMEITFDQRHPKHFGDTCDMIRLVADAMHGKMIVGAGTVLSPHQAELAVNAGAAYLISPHTDPAVITRTVELGAVSMPGCMTPSEAVTAYQAGADFIKLFPAGTLGTDYIKAIKAPLSHIPMLAVGGVDEHNISAFLKAGCVGVGIGSNLVNPKWTKEGRFDLITEAAGKFYAAAFQP